MSCKLSKQKVSFEKLVIAMVRRFKETAKAPRSLLPSLWIKLCVEHYPYCVEIVQTILKFCMLLVVLLITTRVRCRHTVQTHSSDYDASPQRARVTLLSARVRCVSRVLAQWNGCFWRSNIDSNPKSEKISTKAHRVRVAVQHFFLDVCFDTSPQKSSENETRGRELFFAGPDIF